MEDVTGLAFLAMLVGLWMVFPLLGAWGGRRRGRTTEGFLLGCLLGPLGCLLVPFLSERGGGRCPACREVVQREATICPHCRTALSYADVPPPAGGWKHRGKL